MSTNQLSPRRYPRSPTVTPPRWKKPEDVMRKHKVKVKENALIARMNNIATSPTQVRPLLKRKNPFSASSCGDNGLPEKKVKPTETVGEDSLLEILGISESKAAPQYTLGPKVERVTQTIVKESHDEDSHAHLPVDWTLRSKMRFITTKPLPWSLALKTCEEASGITGFVRCIDWKSDPRVDTSLNGQFHQSCLVWVQPNFPWLQVFPRHNVRRTGKPSPFIAHPDIKGAIHGDWAKSLHSLIQLVRARHCPYFYMAANSFTCLFRAAGINGSQEMNAVICPTTKGFRKLLTDDGIDYILPLKSEKRRSNGPVTDDEDEALDEESDRAEEDEGDWLSSLGIEEEVCRIKEPQEMGSVKKEDKDFLDKSLVRVDGTGINALLNLLINCKSVVEPGGPLCGVPPTLISPVAFPGGTLTPLKVSESTVKVDGERFHTMEVRGPIVPSTVLNLTSILHEHLNEFSVTFANVEPTKSFSLVTEPEKLTASPQKGSSEFDKGALSDSGLDPKLLSVFCSPQVKVFDSIRYCGKYYLS